jgi:hypothetical protein
MRSARILVLAALVVGGCATSTQDYRQPERRQFSHSKTIDAPFDTVWDKLVKGLAGDFFVINNIDRASRLINLSFSAPRPGDYVDCGTTTRVFKFGVLPPKSVTYQVAESASFQVASLAGEALNLRRSSRLEGRTNIYVEPTPAGTTMTVNTRYAVSVELTVSDLAGRQLSRQNFVFDPSTQRSFANQDLTCFATGRLEEGILDLVR